MISEVSMRDMMRSAPTVSRAVMNAWSLKFPLVVTQILSDRCLMAMAIGAP